MTASGKGYKEAQGSRRLAKEVYHKHRSKIHQQGVAVDTAIVWSLYRIEGVGVGALGQVLRFFVFFLFAE